MIYKTGDFVKYIDDEQQHKLGRLRAILINNKNEYILKIQKVLLYGDLPGNLKSSIRYNQSYLGEVWLQDEPFQIITVSQVYNKAVIIIDYQHQTVYNNSLYITEIVSKYQGH